MPSNKRVSIAEKTLSQYQRTFVCLWVCTRMHHDETVELAFAINQVFYYF